MKPPIQLNLRDWINTNFNEDIIPDYIWESVTKFKGIVDSQKRNGNDDSSLVEFIKLLELPQKSYNPDNLIELIMLTFVHDAFRNSLGLSEGQRYINKTSDCSDPSFIKRNANNSTKTNSTGKDFCESIYQKTYPSNNLFKITGSLETKLKEVLLNANKDYVITDQISWDEAIRTQSEVSPKFADINLGHKANKTGIFGLEEDTQKIQFNDLISKAFSNKNIIFVYDSNGLNNEWIKHKRYKGMFVDYDSNNQDADTSTKKGGMAPPVKKVRPNANLISTSHPVEFQEYKLSKSKQELGCLDEIKVQLEREEYVIQTTVGGQVKFVNITQKSKGLPMFLKLFDEINKKTLGYKTISTKDLAKQLKEGLEMVGLKDLKKIYKITLADVDDDQNYTRLKKEDFIRALFDFKRAMDYFYVKATLTANMREKRAVGENTPQKRKFIFVSADLSAICYSIFLNNPCILTHNTKDGLSMEIFNPDEVYYNYDEIGGEPVAPKPNNSRSNQVQPQKSQNSSPPPSSTKNGSQAGPSKQPNTNNAKTTGLEKVYLDQLTALIKSLGTSVPKQIIVSENGLSKDKGTKTFDLETQCAEFIQMYENKDDKIPNPFGKNNMDKSNFTYLKTICDDYVQFRNPPKQNQSQGQSRSQVQPSNQTRQNSATRKLDMKTFIDTKINTNPKMKAKIEYEENQYGTTRKFVKIPESGLFELTFQTCRDFKRAYRSEDFNKKTNKFYRYNPEYNQYTTSDNLTSKFIKRSQLYWDALNDICDNFLKLQTQSAIRGGANTTSTQNIYVQVSDSIVDQEIPIDRDLTSICEFGSPLYIFLQFYSQLTPTITFFWFVAFKALMFVYFGDDMDRADCIIFNQVSSPVNVYNSNNNAVQTRTNVKSQNNNTRKAQVNTQSSNNDGNRSQTVSQLQKGVQATIPHARIQAYSYSKKPSINFNGANNVNNGEKIGVFTNRTEPFVSAKDHPVGTQMRGQDGDMYVVRIWEKGNGKPQMWFRLENADKNNAVPYKVIRKRTQMMEEKKIWQ